MNQDALQGITRVILDKVAFVGPVPEAIEEAKYDDVFSRVVGKLPALQAEVEKNRRRIRARYADLVDQPRGRRETVLANSSPSMLLALAYDLMRQSYAARFTEPKRSLELATLAHETAEAVARADYLSPESVADLLAEALGYLGNARRINSDVPGAERVFAEAEEYLEKGTRDRALRARQLGFRAALFHSKGQAREAAGMWDRQVALRRLLRDPDKLGVALLDRGLVACWEGDVQGASEYIRQGIELVEDPRLIYLGLMNLAEALARDGEGADAWKLLCLADLVGDSVEIGTLELRQRWTKALAHRAMGQPELGERLLRSVIDELKAADLRRAAAIATIDLMAVCLAQGKREGLIELAQEAYAAFVAEGLDSRALSVFVVLHRAVQADRLSEELAVRVANFLVRFQHNRNLTFKWPEA